MNLNCRQSLLTLASLFAVLLQAPLFAAEPPVAADASAADKEEFFEKQIRPILVARCQECHGGKKQQGGLRLDSQAGLSKGGDSGQVVVSGNVAESRLIDVIRFDPNDIQMPPSGKLPDDQIAALETWVRIGAPWPKTATPTPTPMVGGSGEIDFAAARQSHWSFRPIVEPELPTVQDGSRVQSPIDRFVISRLQEQGLPLAPPADRRTLIRRATVDLIGLPPTYAEVEAFVHDEAPDAYARLVDRLLESPRYGEKWGRHWLDIARYADTKGYVFTEEIRYPYSYTYRDYVIRAFNEDRPYDQFLKEQIAADQLGLKANDPALAGLGLLTVGQRFRNSKHDIIDDRIDVVTRGLMGFTVGCARCHDHKYDPIPTDDYYSLYGVFASSYEPDVPPLIGTPEQSAAYDAYKLELDKRQAALDGYVSEQHQLILAQLRSDVPAYLLQAQIKPEENVSGFGLSFGKGEPRPQVIRKWKDYLKRRSTADDSVFSPWHQLASVSAETFKTKVDELVTAYSETESTLPVNRLLREAICSQPPGTLADLAKTYGNVLAEVDRQWQELQKAEPAADGQPVNKDQLADPAAEELRQVLYANDSPVVFSVDEVGRLFDRAIRNKQRQLNKKISEWRVASPDAPPRAMVMLDSDSPMTPHVFIRGNAGRRGKKVDRRFPQLLSRNDSTAFSNGSGRRELAEAIADADNPLTSRVFVNRVWAQLFGAGLVRTLSDFGIRSEPPSHPQLLDYLARQFTTQGWSIKKLQRMILLSATYQQSSFDRPDCREIDPENRLLWRMPERRLEFEAFRDALLAVSGQLTFEVGGRPVDIEKQPFSTRRTVYGFVNRNNLPNLFRTFDFPNPDASSPGRPETTVPQQALFGMNSEFVLQQAHHLANHADVVAHSDPAERVRELFRRVYARDPDADELQLALAYVQSAADSQETKDNADNKNALPIWDRFAQVLLLSNEFMFID